MQEVSDFSGTIPKSLFMMNNEALNDTPEIDLDLEADPMVVLDQIFLTVLSRRPTSEERLVFGDMVGNTPTPNRQELAALQRRRPTFRPQNRNQNQNQNRRPPDLPPRVEAYLDVYWTLLNSAEFAYNH